ncbi:MAG: FliH/SctL family protein [Miltoncostaeaceae bacterium]
MSPRPLRAARVVGEPYTPPIRSTAELLAPPPPDTPEGALAFARNEADALVEGARAGIDEARRSATEEGYAAGYRDGEQAIADAVAAARSLIDELEAERQRRPDAAAEDVTIVALEIAARLVRAEVQVHPERVLDVVKGAIRRASQRDVLLVRVHPDDLALVRDATPDLMSQMGGVDRLDVIEEPRVSRGSCVLETPAGDVDATFPTQLERLLGALLDPPDTTLVAEEQ